VNLLGDSIHTIRKKTETLGDPSKEDSLEINAVKTKYIFTCRGSARDENNGF
jgi:hypothetical protein